MRFSKFTALIFAMLLVASCNKAEKIDPRAGGGGLSGNWVSGDRIFTATLSNGDFTARANDTNEVISQGSYVVVSTERIDLKWQGNVTNQANSAVCQRPSDNILSCTDAGGKAFVLNKVVT